MFHLKRNNQPWWSGGLITTNSNGRQLNSQFQHSRLVKHPYLMAIRHWNSIFVVFCTYLLVLVAPPLFVPFNVGSWQVTGGNELAKYWPPLNFSGSTFNGQLSYYSFMSLREYIHLASTPMLRFVAARIPSLKPQFSQLNPHLSHGFKAAMESPSTKRAYAATLAASLGVANEEVGVESKMAIWPSMVVSEKCGFNSIKNRDVLC